MVIPPMTLFLPSSAKYVRFSSTNRLSYLLFYEVIVAWFSETGLVHFYSLLLHVAGYILLVTQNSRVLLRLRSITPYFILFLFLSV